jgi:hypothetical protein
MGTDIHLFLEKWEKISKKWIFHQKIDANRNYDIFSLLCGIRPYYECIPIFSFEKLHLPNDLSDYVEKEVIHWECDGHSFGVLTINDIDTYQYWNIPYKDTREITYNVITPKDVYDKSQFKDIVHIMRQSEKKGIPMRLIFWFDN